MNVRTESLAEGWETCASPLPCTAAAHGNKQERHVAQNKGVICIRGGSEQSDVGGGLVETWRRRMSLPHERDRFKGTVHEAAEPCVPSTDNMQQEGIENGAQIG